ncbi:MAG: hypothetical protein HOV97_31380 [Nonomuraea sp.]|nr:hypothetical protein [Nonomuraea sp.]
MADGRADVGVVSLPVYVDGLVTKELYAEPYLPAYPEGQPDPRSLPIIDWHENCAGETRRRPARQEWIPPGDITVEDDGVVMSMGGTDSVRRSCPGCPRWMRPRRSRRLSSATARRSATWGM